MEKEQTIFRKGKVKKTMDGTGLEGMCSGRSSTSRRID